MNRHALVLAADSATTATAWINGEKEERYFKGANKIFQLSNYHPVALMIFDSADVLRVPWEIVVKEFRSLLGQKSFNDLAGYAAEFFAFLETEKRLFPDEVEKAVFLELADGASLRFVLGVARLPGSTDADHIAALDTAVAAAKLGWDALPLGVGVTPEAENHIRASWLADLELTIQDSLTRFGLAGPTDLGVLADIVIQAMLKAPEAYFGTTGLVVAGFGDHAVFPAMIEYKSCGLVGGHHVVREVSRAEVDHNVPAAISAFAQTSMSDTFQLGFSADSYKSIMDVLDAELPIFSNDVVAGVGGANPVPDLDVLIQTAKDRIGNAWLVDARSQHTFPLRRVLGLLPVDEMAELAETLINLQSLKEKVTKPSETVGGPIDVAVVTKNEGLVWVKRKHYFDPKLNSRFMQRQAALYN